MDRWAHQPVAVAAITAQLGAGGRTTMLSACGSGKSLIAAKAARVLVPDGPVLVLVPRLEVAEQMLGTFQRVGGAGRLVAVCSDEEILDAGELGLGGVVTTKPAQIAAAVAGPGRVTVVGTYASQRAIVAAHADHRLGPWGLIVADEAHRTAGPAGRAWSLLHDDVLIPARRRLYMTATARIFTGNFTTAAGPVSGAAEVAAVSMDDEKVFGPVCFELKTGEGIKRGLLADWQLLVAVCDPALLEDEAPLRVGRTALAPRVLAQQTAVLRAAAEHDIRALLTYHSRVAAARGWAMTVPQTRELMPAELRPSWVQARHVHGQQSPAERRRILQQLAAAPDDPNNGRDDGDDGAGGGGGGLRLVANARVLTEGIDIPAVDGVALIDPRSSIIDIIQIIGRALRIGDRPGKVAKIIVPLLLNPQESAEQALEESAFKPLWRVLLALRAHDDRLERGLDAARARLGGNTSGSGDPAAVPDWLSISGGRVPDGFARAVWLKAVRAAAPVWMEYYGAAKAWRDEHGDLNVPYDHRTEGGLGVGQWLPQQYGAGWDALTDQQRDLLTQIGPWESEDERRWRKAMAAACAWVTDHPQGLHDIPRSWTHDGVVLWDRIARYRIERRAGRLTAARDAELCALDPTWYLRGPEIMVREARAFYREHGHLLPDPGYCTATGRDLNARLDWCRRAAGAGTLNPAVRGALTRLGMYWTVREAQLGRGLLAARAHLAAHGTLAIPATHVCQATTCGDDYPTGRFLAQQKQSNRDGTLRGWVRATLNALDPGWYRTKADRREHKLALAAAYAKIHGHLPHAKGYGPTSPAPDGEDFRPWLAEMRLKARKGTIPADIRDRLTAIDPNWCPDLAQPTTTPPGREGEPTT